MFKDNLAFCAQSVFGNSLKVMIKYELCGMLAVQYVRDVGFWICSILEIWDTGDVAC